MKTIEIEDVATVFASEFVKYCNKHEVGRLDASCTSRWFLKMNYNRRRKICENVLDKMLGENVGTFNILGANEDSITKRERRNAKRREQYREAKKTEQWVKDNI